MKTARNVRKAAIATTFVLLATKVCLSPRVLVALAGERQLGQVRMGIHLMRANGSEAHPLAVSGEYFHHGSPAWSPDGKRLAFDAYKSEFQAPAIFLCDADGSNLRELTPGAYPRWSPDGKQLVLYSGLQSGDNPEIFLVEVDGSNRRRLVEGMFADWSPDGKTIVFGRQGDDRGIWTIDPDGNGLRRIAATPDDPFVPVWSPDGKRIAFSQSGNRNLNLYLIDAEGGAIRQLTAGEGHDLFPNWSPDGKQIAFVRYDRELSEADVYVIDTVGSKERPITSESGYQIDPTWSPDGKWIAYGAEK